MEDSNPRHQVLEPRVLPTELTAHYDGLWVDRGVNPSAVAALLSGGTPGAVTFHPGVPRSPVGAKQVPTFREQRDVGTGANRGGIFSALFPRCLLGYVSMYSHNRCTLPGVTIDNM